MNKKKPAKATHSVHDINYHLVLTTEHLRKTITDETSEELRGIFERIGKKHGVKVKEWEHGKDHVHVLYTALPTTHHAKLVNAYKSASSRLVKKNHPETAVQLQHGCFWSRSYYIATSGSVSTDAIASYVREQGE